MSPFWDALFLPCKKQSLCFASDPLVTKYRYIPGTFLGVTANILSRSTQIQSTEWSMHSQVLQRICQKWFSPHPDLFTTCSNHMVLLYLSAVPDQQALKIDALNINWSQTICIPSLGSPLQGNLENPSVQLSHNPNSPRLAKDALVSGPSAALNRNPTPVASIEDTFQAVSHPIVSQPTIPQPSYLAS